MYYCTRSFSLSAKCSPNVKLTNLYANVVNVLTHFFMKVATNTAVRSKNVKLVSASGIG